MFPSQAQVLGDQKLDGFLRTLLGSGAINLSKDLARILHPKIAPARARTLATWLSKQPQAMRSLVKLDVPSQVGLLMQYAQQGSVLELLLAPDCKVRELLEPPAAGQSSSSTTASWIAATVQVSLLLEALRAEAGDALIVLLEKAPLSSGVLSGRPTAAAAAAGLGGGGGSAVTEAVAGVVAAAAFRRGHGSAATGPVGAGKAPPTVFVRQAVLNDLKPEHMKKLLELGLPINTTVGWLGLGWVGVSNFNQSLLSILFMVFSDMS